MVRAPLTQFSIASNIHKRHQVTELFMYSLLNVFKERLSNIKTSVFWLPFNKDNMLGLKWQI